MKIFVTGATGFLGQYLIRELSPLYEEIFVLSRNADNKCFADLSNVKVIAGDITNPHLIASNEQHEILLEEVDTVIHAAALYDIKSGHAESYLHNVVGTQNVLHLLKKMKKLKSFYYISTIAVGDDQTLILEEDQLPLRRVFNDHYSETKYIAEKLVRDNSALIPTRIIRPGIIVGDSKTGKIDKGDGPYYFMNALKKHALLLKSIPVIPLSYNPKSKIAMIPVDHCAHFIGLLLKRDDFNKTLKTYHLISEETPTIRNFLKDVNEHLNIKTTYVPVFKNPFHGTLLNLLGIPKELVPFMFSRISYDKTRTLNELPEIKESSYSSYKDKLFLYLSK